MNLLFKCWFECDMISVIDVIFIVIVFGINFWNCLIFYFLIRIDLFIIYNNCELMFEIRYIIWGIGYYKYDKRCNLKNLRVILFCGLRKLKIK